MRLPILCYHRVGLASEEGRRLNIEPTTLEEHVRFFVRKGWRFIHSDRLDEAWGRNCVWLTFDDAYASALTYGVDALTRHGATATFYAVPGCVGDWSRWDQVGQSRLGDWGALRSAQDAGFEIGNHTMRHPAMGELNFEQQTDEWRLARTAFESQGIATRSACLPFGSWNADTERALDAAGYSVCVALSRRPARAADSRLLLPRIVVAYSDRLPMLLFKMYLRPWLPRLKSRPHYIR